MSNLLLIGHNLPNVPPPVGPQPGDPMGGGFYVGKMNYSGLTYNLIVAAQATETALAWKTAATADAGPISLYDGLANSNSINDASHPAAQYCRAYTGGGNNDWYLGARDEMELLFRNLKPIVFNNDTAPRAANCGGGGNGINPNSIPVGAQYTLTDPGQTAAANFRNTGTQFLNSSGSAYWTSTQAIGASPNTNNAIAKFMSQGNELAVGKTNPTGIVRPMRRVWVPPAIGDAVGGGYYAGIIVIGGLRYALILAPKASETQLRYRTTLAADAGATSRNDGLTNSNSMNDANHPAAQYCRAYTGGGNSDWYFAGADEWELCYRNFKPMPDANVSGSRSAQAGGGLIGANANSDPTLASYSGIFPAQTTLPLFVAGGAQALQTTDVYITSTQAVGNNNNCMHQHPVHGLQDTVTKTYATGYVRPVRRILIS